MDNHASPIKAGNELGILTEFSQPGVPQTNGVIESVNGDILRRAISLMVEAGLPACFWPLAARCYCHHENVRTDVEGSSPWLRRHGEPWPLQHFPFGCGVFCKPSPTRAEPGKTEPVMRFGIFLGYRCPPGDRWNGEFLVAELKDLPTGHWPPLKATRISTSARVPPVM